MCRARRPSGVIGASGPLNSVVSENYRMLRFGTEYVDRGQDYYEQPYQSRVVSPLMRRAQELGDQLIKNEHPPLATSSPA